MTAPPKPEKEMPWNRITRIAVGVFIKQYIPGDLSFNDKPDERHELFYAVPESEARFLLAMKERLAKFEEAGNLLCGATWKLGGSDKEVELAFQGFALLREAMENK